KELDKIVAATSRKARPLKGEDNIGVRVGKVIKKFNVEKHFNIEIEENSFSSQRNQSKIDAEAVLDGFYIIISTSLDEETLSATDTVKAEKNLSQVEQAYRRYKTVDLKVRSIYHYTAERVKAHIDVCYLIMM
ncbi:MAG: IS1634 family transposase, partial [Richelia sp.]|nr:IS1634 family transposase [Richelia sp.]